ncbi:hypothetical protein D3C80_242000 [compost metagenome]
MSAVVGGVVYQHGDGADLRASTGDGRPQGVQVGQVAVQVERHVPRIDEAIDKRRGGTFVHIEEGDTGALASELFDEGGADAAGAPGNQHAAVDQAGVQGETGHQWTPGRFSGRIDRLTIR